VRNFVAEVIYSGSSDQFPGKWQVNAKIPPADAIAARGQFPIFLVSGANDRARREALSEEFPVAPIHSQRIRSRCTRRERIQSPAFSRIPGRL